MAISPMKYPFLAGTVAAGLVGLDALKSDGTDLTETYRGFHVGAGGNVKFNDGEGNTLTIAVNSGTYYPYTISRLWTTNTTATGIFGVR